MPPRAWINMVCLIGRVAGVLSMTELAKSVELKAAADRVWAVIGQFGDIAQWHPVIDAGRVEEVDGKRRRLLAVTGGGTLIEQLDAVDDGAMSYSYSLIDGPLPVEDYHSTIAVMPVDESHCRVTWTGRFRPKPGTTESQAIQVIESIYTTGFDALRKQFEH